MVPAGRRAPGAVRRRRSPRRPPRQSPRRRRSTGVGGRGNHRPSPPARLEPGAIAGTHRVPSGARRGRRPGGRLCRTPARRRDRSVRRRCGRGIPGGLPSAQHRGPVAPWGRRTAPRPRIDAGPGPAPSHRELRPRSLRRRLAADGLIASDPLRGAPIHPRGRKHRVGGRRDPGVPRPGWRNGSLRRRCPARPPMFRGQRGGSNRRSARPALTGRSAASTRSDQGVPGTCRVAWEPRYSSQR